MEVKIALDTNRYTDMCRGIESVVETIEQADYIYIPFVVLAELRAGFAVGTRGRENERYLRRFLVKEDVYILYPDEQTIFQYASVFKQLREQGTPIPVHDMWIAALVLQHNLLLCARDRHFDSLPQIGRV
jgi:tRNA(fMet)-specific endonuclease VapC